MGRLRCYCFDQSCRATAPRVEPDNQVALPVVVGRSVGQGGANVRNDVLTIQQALNAVGTSQGGPTPRLATDGLMGPLTRAAIGRFQKQNISFVDFRIDPNGPTIQALNRILRASLPILASGSSRSLAPRSGVGQVAPPAPTFTVTDEMMEQMFDDTLPISRACVKSALRTLTAAKVMGTIESPAQTLVRKHFAVLLSDPPPPDFVLIERTFRAIDRELSVAALSPATTFIKFPFTLSFNEMAESRTLALAISNGVTMRGETVQLDRTNGTSATLRADAVVIAPVYFFASSDLQIGTLIHELAHFVGRPDGHPDCIDDPPDRSSSDASLARLPPDRRPRIAEFYALFAFEAHFGRSMFRVLLQF
ncbi:peptidoglycan-binding protein [Bradyrhizobium sp. 2S1]|uniref:peptidoglycan-binding protein n=1 Tax=Bradyrhizobium sp. 2S1 TaxID=1404429 RepID=UPI00140D1D67|nr:peptidoglycan-binding protein [Bradyrhizobium sp. 2S1]MCK7673916.1 peptidoglycan-binding protein [Bradyrhizobium sp. 2S1]